MPVSMSDLSREDILRRTLRSAGLHRWRLVAPVDSILQNTALGAKWTIRQADEHSLERFNSDAVIDRTTYSPAMSQSRPRPIRGLAQYEDRGLSRPDQQGPSGPRVAGGRSTLGPGRIYPAIAPRRGNSWLITGCKGCSRQESTSTGFQNGGTGQFPAVFTASGAVSRGGSGTSDRPEGCYIGKHMATFGG
jgi:hypothetical protein